MRFLVLEAFCFAAQLLLILPFALQPKSPIPNNMEKSLEKSSLLTSRESVAGDRLLTFDEIRTSLLIMAESVPGLTTFRD